MYIKPQHVTHTQNTQQSWLETKIRILKKMTGVPMSTLQTYLDFTNWKCLRSYDASFLLLSMIVLDTLF